MRGIVFTVAATLVAFAADAANPGGAPVTVQNTPLPVIVENAPSVNVANSPTVSSKQSGPWAVSVSGTPTVVIGNSAAEAIPVTGDLASAPSEPFHVTNYGSISPGQTQPNVWFSVPSGKRLVIEHVSALVGVPAGQAIAMRVAVPQPTMVQHRLVTSSAGSLGGGEDWFVASQPIRMYADGQFQALFVEVLRSSSTGYGTIEASVSGYLVDLP